MTESDWLASCDPLEMLYQFGGDISLRKLRLFACACLRRTSLCREDAEQQRIVHHAELVAEAPLATLLPVNDEDDPDKGLLRDDEDECDDDEEESVDEHDDEEKSADEADENPAMAVLAEESYLAARQSVLVAIEDCTRRVSYMSGHWHATRESEAAALAALLREVIGVPRQIAAMEPNPLDPLEKCAEKIRSLAQAAYDERELPSGHLDAKRLAILADALEESGCTNEDVLTHLRGEGPHVRGCWVVDLLLGRE
jgi:hypothetical protein